MAKMNFDEEGLLEEPCLSCDKSYVENIWYEWCCDERECPYRAESEDMIPNKEEEDDCTDIYCENCRNNCNCIEYLEEQERMNEEDDE